MNISGANSKQVWRTISEDAQAGEGTGRDVHQTARPPKTRRGKGTKHFQGENTKGQHILMNVNVMKMMVGSSL